MALKKTVTINDVAEAAGVSKTTVSRYLNGQLNMISPATQKRIETVIKMSNYIPSDIASNLKKKTTNLIGLVVSDIMSPFSASLITGISEYLEELGYTLLITNAADNPQKEATILRSLIGKGISGLIVNTSSYQNDYLVQIKCSGIPVVLCDRYVRDHKFDIVTTNPDVYVKELIAHLKQTGYTRPVFFTQEWHKNSTRTRKLQAFLNSMQEIYGRDAANDVFIVPEKKNATRTLLENLLCSKQENDIFAIVGTNSLTTVRAYHAISELNLSIPNQIGLCGTEDWDWSDELNWPYMIRPNVTTMSVPTKELGQETAKLLVKRLEAPEAPPEEIFVNSTLHVRGSTQYNAK